MQFEDNKSIENCGKYVGYLTSYFIFTTILFLILGLLKKIPDSWNYIHIVAITAAIALAGLLLKKILK